MTEKPILFSGPMVRAILAGTKTQTRRVFKLLPDARYPDGYNVRGISKIVGPHETTAGSPEAVGAWTPIILAGEWPTPRKCPYGVPGDRLWVRETWNMFDPDEDPIPSERFGSRAPYDGVCNGRPIRWTACYAADGPISHPTDGAARWRPSIFMPRWASRLTLEVTEVRVQRVQEISEEDALAEGARCMDWATAREAVLGDGSYRAHFAHLWESINGKRPGCDWASNPWVWCVSFRRLP